MFAGFLSAFADAAVFFEAGIAITTACRTGNAKAHALERGALSFVADFAIFDTITVVFAGCRAAACACFAGIVTAHTGFASLAGVRRALDTIGDALERFTITARRVAEFAASCKPTITVVFATDLVGTFADLAIASETGFSINALGAAAAGAVDGTIDGSTDFVFAGITHFPLATITVGFAGRGGFVWAGLFEFPVGFGVGIVAVNIRRRTRVCLASVGSVYDLFFRGFFGGGAVRGGLLITPDKGQQQEQEP